MHEEFRRMRFPKKEIAPHTINTGGLEMKLELRILLKLSKAKD